MTRTYMKRILFAALVTTLSMGAYAAPVPMLTLIPTSAVGAPGGVTGWGYDILNEDPNDFLVLNDSFVTGSLSTGVFGTYMDYLASTFIVIGPGLDSGPVPFVKGTSGVGEFDFDKFVPIPTTISGGISIDYSLFSQDPNDPNFDPGSLVDSGTVSSTAAAIAGPEPGSALLMGALLLPLAFAYRRRSTKRC